jgi:hypothetical protein
MNECYFCGIAATSREHVPPKSLFGGGAALITVPSCAEHNSVRSKHDEYMRLVVSGTAWTTVPEAVRGKIERSASRGRGPARRVLEGVYGRRHYDAEMDRLNTCAEAMARAIIFHEYGSRPPVEVRPEVVCHFLECTLDASPAIVSLYEDLKRSALLRMAEVEFTLRHPGIFKYKSTPACVHLCLYETCNITVTF